MMMRADLVVLGVDVVNRRVGASAGAFTDADKVAHAYITTTSSTGGALLGWLAGHR